MTCLSDVITAWPAYRVFRIAQSSWWESTQCIKKHRYLLIATLKSRFIVVEASTTRGGWIDCPFMNVSPVRLFNLLYNLRSLKQQVNHSSPYRFSCTLLRVFLNLHNLSIWILYLARNLQLKTSRFAMVSRHPALGSLAVQAPSLTPQIVHVSPTTCHNLSLFKGF